MRRNRIRISSELQTFIFHVRRVLFCLRRFVSKNYFEILEFVSGHTIFECSTTWGLYVACLSFTTNFSSFVAHLFINKSFTVECIVFAFDLFGAVILGNLLAMSYTAYAFAAFQSPATNLLTGILLIKVNISSLNKSLNKFRIMALFQFLGCILFVTSSTRYSTRCLEEFKQNGPCNCSHVDVVESIKHCFPICAILMFSVAAYTATVHIVLLFTVLLL